MFTVINPMHDTHCTALTICAHDHRHKVQLNLLSEQRPCTRKVIVGHLYVFVRGKIHVPGMIILVLVGYVLVLYRMYLHPVWKHLANSSRV